MLKRVTLDKKTAMTLSPVKRLNASLDKAIGDKRDIQFFKSSDGKKTYVRVWDSGAEAGTQAQMYEVSAGAETPAATPLDAK